MIELEAAKDPDIFSTLTYRHTGTGVKFPEMVSLVCCYGTIGKLFRWPERYLRMKKLLPSRVDMRLETPWSCPGRMIPLNY